MGDGLKSPLPLALIAPGQGPFGTLRSGGTLRTGRNLRLPPDAGPVSE